ncbi:hypothetical protein NSMS1_67370 (plasmid) [Nostoc sp. MS1]|nr:hypothetical protein NSMS1_67370 [Nostoc sp. MS1]
MLSWRTPTRCYYFVILDEDLRMGKVVGFLMSDSLLKTAEYIDNNFDDSFILKDIIKFI